MDVHGQVSHETTPSNSETWMGRLVGHGEPWLTTSKLKPECG